MRKISANLIFPVTSPPLPNGIIMVDDKGIVLELIDTGGSLREVPGLEFYPGIILPGFVLPCLRLAEQQGSLEELDRGMIRNGIKGAGVVLGQSFLTDEGLELMRNSPVSYHPILELCPSNDKEDFSVFTRGVELLSHAWNEFNLTGSLVPCRDLDDLSELKRYIREYNAAHDHVRVPGYNTDNKEILLEKPIEYPPEVSLNILEIIRRTWQDSDLRQILPGFTLDAAAWILEEDALGSLEPGKRPGLNLVTGIDTGSLKFRRATSLRVLV
jgi:hypothetical protein